jgi:hypothetical protein
MVFGTPITLSDGPAARASRAISWAVVIDPFPPV